MRATRIIAIFPEEFSGPSRYNNNNPAITMKRLTSIPATGAAGLPQFNDYPPSE